MKELEEIIIDRNTWYRGNGHKESRLLRIEDSKMCCLGFFCKHFGAEDEEIRDADFPWDVGNDRDEIYREKVDIDFEKADDWFIMIGGINDNYDITDEEREKAISEEWAKKGFKAVFIN